MVEFIKSKIRSLFPWTTDLSKKIVAKTWPQKSIVYYLGRRMMTVESDFKNKAVSGSDAAVYFLSREWVKLGYDVTVYLDNENQESIYDGVRYVHFRKFNGYDRFSTLIIWRHPDLLLPFTQARRIWFDWHDIVYNPQSFTSKKLNLFDKICAKSYYQRSLLPHQDDEQFIIINNGVNPFILTLLEQPRNPYKLIYASRYYRGLEYMLKYGWPLIKMAIPEAELHIYYGWTRRDEYADCQPWKKEMLELMKQPGVFEHGGVGQQQLIDEKLSSSIHYYGCTYEEIDCISVRESAIVGCVPVTTDYAVFQEKDYCVKVSGNPTERETQERLAKKIIELLQNPVELARLRGKFRELAQVDTWETVAQKWIAAIEASS